VGECHVLLIPPIVPNALTDLATPEEVGVQQIISQIAIDVEEAKDNLLQAKIFQAHYANQHYEKEHKYAVGNNVMLSTLHRHNKYKKKGGKCIAKFFPHYDGPYLVIDVHPEASTYTLELPNHPNVFPTYHASELVPHVANDPSLFPDREDECPPPIVTPDGIEEYFVKEILDAHPCGRGWQYLVRWSGYSPEHDRWLPRTALEDCEVLNHWLGREADTR
jgi:hypothetical protein